MARLLAYKSEAFVKQSCAAEGLRAREATFAELCKQVGPRSNLQEIKLEQGTKYGYTIIFSD